MTVFRASEAKWISVYKGMIFENQMKPAYGLCVKTEEIPEDLRLYSKDKDGWSMVRNNRPPTVVCDRDLSTTIRLSEAANIQPDTLLQGIPMDLNVEPIEFESGGNYGYRRGQTVYLLRLAAIRVTFDDVTKRYDQICAGLFDDPDAV